jgi:hypothetical protein
VGCLEKRLPPRSTARLSDGGYPLIAVISGGIEAAHERARGDIGTERSTEGMNLSAASNITSQ